MNPSYFSSLLDATELLDNAKAHDALVQMQSVYQQKQYFVAFIGQYSAGKSCLLNSLLKRRLLPEGTTETTPLLTYIRYGEREEAKLHYMDGTVQILEIAQVAQLAQQTEESCWDLNRLEFLEVYLNEDMLRSGMILLDTPGVNTLIERHEHLLESSLAIASGIIYVAGHAPSLVDVDKLSMLTDSGFDVYFVRTHCDNINEQEETLDQVKKADEDPLSKCGIAPERRYYVSNKADSPLFAELKPLRNMLVEKGSHAGLELETSIEQQLLVQAKQCKAALEERRAVLDQVHTKNAEALAKRRTELLDRIKQLEARLEETDTVMRKRVESCRKALQEDVKAQIETSIQSSGKRIEENREVVDEKGMTALLRREVASFSRSAYQLINATLDPLVREINGEISGEGIELETLALPQAINYQELRAGQDELTSQLRNQLAVLHEDQADLTQALATKVGSPEYLQLQRELQELQAVLMEIQQERANLPPYVPKMIVEEDGRMQPSQIARSIGAAADWAMLLIPGAQVEAAIGKISKIPKVSKAMGKFVGILEKAGKAAKQGDTIKDILFTLKNLGDHTRTSKRREKIAGKAVGNIAKGVGTSMDALHSAKQNNDSGSILDLLTIEHWAGKLGEQFDRPPRLTVDKEYEAQYKEAKEKLETKYREIQQKAYQKKQEMGLLQKEEERLRAREDSLRIDQEAVSRDLAEREAELREKARDEALKRWRHDCAAWYQNEVNQRIQAVIDVYTADFPARLEEYQDQRLQALREALEREQASYDELENMPEDEIALELRRVKELLNQIDGVSHE